MRKRNPDLGKKCGQQRLYAAVVLLTLIWCILIFMPPLLARIDGGNRYSFLIRLFFAPICHQSSHRSFSIGGIPLAVCARCTGIYLGFLAGVLIMPFIRRQIPRLDYRNLVLGGLAFMGLEFLLTHSVLPPLGLWRAISGIWIGGVTALLTLISLFELQYKRHSKQRNRYG